MQDVTESRKACRSLKCTMYCHNCVNKLYIHINYIYMFNKVYTETLAVFPHTNVCGDFSVAAEDHIGLLCIMR